MQRGNDIISLKADIILIILIYFQILDMFRLFLAFSGKCRLHRICWNNDEKYH